MKKDLSSEKEVSNLIIKILTDQASPDECLVLDNWVKKSDENRLFFLHFRNIWMASSQVIKAEKTNIPKALEIVNHKINEINPDEVRLNGKKVFPGRKSNLFSYVRIAALWVLIFGMGALFSMLFLKPEKILNFNSAVSVITPRGSKALTVLLMGL
ncbi:MAG: hypothetical protein IPJ37_07685 [Bacteroidales bacterium]|nr:hypothetical protein [Bacteroidales bacterium]